MGNLIRVTRIGFRLFICYLIYSVLKATILESPINITGVMDLMVIKFLIIGVLPLSLTLLANAGISNYKKMVKDQEKEKDNHKKEVRKLYWSENHYQEYEHVKNMFNSMMKSGVLKHKELVKIKGRLNKLLGENLSHYKEFKFENDAHEIYTKLKNSNLVSDDYIELQEVLKLIADSKTEKITQE